MSDSKHFGARLVTHGSGPLALLPTPFATLVRAAGTVRLFGPHSRVHCLQPQGSASILFAEPAFIKALLGHPRYFLNRSFSPAELSLLAVFQDSAPSAWLALLADLRAAVTMTHDEYQFTELWSLLVRQQFRPRDSGQERQAERLCRRYAGQTPGTVSRQLRLARQLARDLAASEHVPTGDYADQSHYIRECRKHTGCTPSEWKNLSATFYRCGQDLQTIRVSLANTDRKEHHGTWTQGDGRSHCRQPENENRQDTG